MNLSKSLTYSLIGSLLLMAGLSILFGGKVLGIFLLLPVGLLMRSRKEKPAENRSSDYHSANPIEPK